MNVGALLSSLSFARRSGAVFQYCARYNAELFKEILERSIK
jgi:hypothetical protein